MRKSITIPNAPKPIGPYSQAVQHNDTLYLSGQIPIDPISGELKTDTIEEATEQVLENIKILVETAGYNMDEIVKCSIFLQSLADFEAVNSVYARYFPTQPPARETVEVARLPKDAPIEISCIAIH